MYLDPEPDAGRVCLRIADPETIEGIQAQTRRKIKEFVHNPKTRAMERVEYFEQSAEQEKKERELTWDWAIQAWEGILDKDGNEIPCTVEHKLKLMNIPVFARFVGHCLRLLASSGTQVEEHAGKN